MFCDGTSFFLRRNSLFCFFLLLVTVMRSIVYIDLIALNKNSISIISIISIGTSKDSDSSIANYQFVCDYIRPVSHYATNESLIVMYAY